MAAGTGTTAVAQPQGAPARPTPQQVIQALPFVSGAHEHVESAFTRSVTPTTSTQQLDPIDVPAYGYARYLMLEVTASGGSGGTLAADGPWNLFSQITLQDVNGNQIYGPMSGYSTYIANLI